MLILLLIFAYLLGSIPFGLLLTRAAGMGDIRAIGSGNIGATNVLRTGNKKLALLTLLLDGGKGWLAVALVNHMINNFNADVPPNQSGMLYGLIIFYLCPLVVVLGHVFPIWLKFKGGKGVATALGAILGFYWPVGAILIVIWLAVFIVTRISSLAALVTFATIPFLALYTGFWFLFPLMPLSLLVIYRHRENIKRLLKGTEPKFGSKK